MQECREVSHEYSVHGGDRHASTVQSPSLPLTHYISNKPPLRLASSFFVPTRPTRAVVRVLTNLATCYLVWPCFVTDAVGAFTS